MTNSDGLRCTADFVATNLIVGIPTKSISINEGSFKPEIFQGNPAMTLLNGSFLARHACKGSDNKMSTHQEYLVMNFAIRKNRQFSALIGDNFNYRHPRRKRLTIRTSVRKDIIWNLCDANSGRYYISRRQLLATSFSVDSDGQTWLFDADTDSGIFCLTDNLKDDWFFHNDDLPITHGNQDGIYRYQTIVSAYLSGLKSKGVNFDDCFSPHFENIHSIEEFLTSWLKTPPLVNFNF